MDRHDDQRDGPDGFDDDGFDDDDDAPVAPRPPSRAAAAPNWRTVVAVDTGVGVAVMVVGVVLAFTWQPVVAASTA